MFEYVVASPHALLRRGEDQTPRILSAVCTPGVAILGHPRGRMFNSRAGVRADRPRVFKAAAERQVAIELDGNWHRQDMDWELAAEALELGCIFALNLRSRDQLLAARSAGAMAAHRALQKFHRGTGALRLLSL
jgi:putative hydrolase